MTPHDERVDCQRELENAPVQCKNLAERLEILRAYWRELCERMNDWKGWK